MVIAEPTTISLPEMSPGDVFNGQIQFTNHGLIQADNVIMSLPADDEFYQYEFLAPPPSVIQAKESVVVAYRVTSLKSLGEESTGGAAGGYGSGGNVSYNYTAACGVTTGGSAGYYFAGQWNPVSGIVNIPGGQGLAGKSGNTQTIGVSGSTGQSSSGASTSQTTIVSGSQPCNLSSNCGNTNGCCLSGGPGGSAGSPFSGSQTHPGPSFIHLILGAYMDDVTDLTFPVPGGQIDVARWFNGLEWAFDFDEELLFEYKAQFGVRPGDTISNRWVYLLNVKRDGIDYTQTAGDFWDIDKVIKVNGADTITAYGYSASSQSVNALSGDRLVWKNTQGQWIEYNNEGKRTSFGDKNGLIGRYLYTGDNITGIEDKNSRQVLTIARNPQGEITDVQDIAGRALIYTWVNNRLTQVDHPSGGISTAQSKANPKRSIRKFVELMGWA